MPITNVQQGKPVRRSKINEVISAVSGIEVSWANVDGVAGELRSSGGSISSAEFLGEGVYKINFDPPLPSAFYAVLANCTQTNDNDTGFVKIMSQGRANCVLRCHNDDGRFGYVGTLCVVVIGPDRNNLTSSLTAVNLKNRTVSVYSDGTVPSSDFITYSLTTAGTENIVSLSASSGTSFIEDTFDLNLFQARATFLSGNRPSGVFDTWLPLTSDLNWTLSPLEIETPPGSGEYPYFFTSCSFRVELRDIASYSIRSSALISLSLVPNPIYDPGGGGGDGNGDGSGGEGAGNGGSL